MLGIKSTAELAHHPQIGSIFESYVFSEYVKRKVNFELTADLYFWKDKSNKEVDILLEAGNITEAIEVKYGQTIALEYFANLENYRFLSKTPVKTSVVYGGQGIHERGNHVVYGWREF